jgi:hypothetical protein
MIQRGTDDVPDANVPHIPWINPDTVGAAFDGINRQSIIKMYVGDDWDGRIRYDFPQGGSGFSIRARGAYDIASGLGGTLDLGNRGGDVLRLGVGHGLDGDWRATAYRETTS